MHYIETFRLLSSFFLFQRKRKVKLSPLLNSFLSSVPRPQLFSPTQSQTFKSFFQKTSNPILLKKKFIRQDELHYVYGIHLYLTYALNEHPKSSALISFSRKMGSNRRSLVVDKPLKLIISHRFSRNQLGGLFPLFNFLPLKKNSCFRYENLKFLTVHN